MAPMTKVPQGGTHNCLVLIIETVSKAEQWQWVFLLPLRLNVKQFLPVEGILMDRLVLGLVLLYLLSDVFIMTYELKTALILPL